MGSLSVSDLLNTGERLGLTLRAGQAGIHRRIHRATIQSYDSGKSFETGKVLTAGPGAAHRLEKASPEFLEILSREIRLNEIPCIIISDGAPPASRLRNLSESLAFPYFTSTYDSDLLESRLLGFLREKIERRTTVGGVLVTWSGKGVLIVGESGSGKSSCARELLSRGGKLVCDDVVEIHRGNEGRIVGKSHASSRYLMEIKGAGVVNLRETIGEGFFAEDATVDLVVGLTRSGREAAGGSERIQILGVGFTICYLPAGIGAAEAADRIIRIIQGVPPS